MSDERFRLNGAHMNEPQKRGPGRPRKIPSSPEILDSSTETPVGDTTALIGADNPDRPSSGVRQGSRELDLRDGIRVWALLPAVTNNGRTEPGPALAYGRAVELEPLEWDGRRKLRVACVLEIDVEPGHQYWRAELVSMVNRS